MQVQRTGAVVAGAVTSCFAKLFLKTSSSAKTREQQGEVGT